MIIGIDLMSQLGICVNTQTKQIHWGEDAVPMYKRGDLDNKESLHTFYHMAVNPAVVEAEEH